MRNLVGYPQSGIEVPYYTSKYAYMCQDRDLRNKVFSLFQEEFSFHANEKELEELKEGDLIYAYDTFGKGVTNSNVHVFKFIKVTEDDKILFQALDPYSLTTPEISFYTGTFKSGFHNFMKYEKLEKFYDAVDELEESMKEDVAS